MGGELLRRFSQLCLMVTTPFKTVPSIPLSSIVTPVMMPVPVIRRITWGTIISMTVGITRQMIVVTVIAKRIVRIPIVPVRIIGVWITIAGVIHERVIVIVWVSIMSIGGIICTAGQSQTHYHDDS